MQPFVPQSLPLPDIDWAAVVPFIGPANRALATYNATLQRLHDPNILLSPLIRDEAVKSSKIEGTQADAIDVMKSEAGEPSSNPSVSEDVREISNYRKSVEYAAEALNERPLTLGLLKELHRILLSSVRGKNKTPGEFRIISNYIAVDGAPKNAARFVPPEAVLVPGCMDNWMNYLNGKESDLLVQLAVIHAQFEIIHPFQDGNGRLGRMMVPLFLFLKGAMSSPSFYMSDFLERNRAQYCDALRDITHGSGWTQWIIFFLKAIEQQASLHQAKAGRICEFYERMKREIVDLTHSQYAVHLLDAMMQKPIFRQPQLRLDVPKQPSRAALYKLLSILEEKGVLASIKRAKRKGTLYFLEGLLDICNETELPYQPVRSS